MTFYKSNIFMCEVTGKTGLDYFQAAESERSESNNLHARFPEQLKAAVLRAVQWRTFVLGVHSYSCTNILCAAHQKLLVVWTTLSKLCTIVTKTDISKAKVSNINLYYS